MSSPSHEELRLKVLRLRADLEAQEDATLAPYAAKSNISRGRLHDVEPDRLRTAFQRDRDRIVHSTSFRKLEHKTQVWASHWGGDYQRTRLTHTKEVSQIAQTLARGLGLNADLAEAIALGHDLGHTPFGHAGEETMAELMKHHGGFEHNAQGLRVVDFLEQRSPNYPGLNLTYEVREGIIKHSSPYDIPPTHPDFQLGRHATLESQVCDLADQVAYNVADLDDALEMGFIEETDLEEVPWVKEHFERAAGELGSRTWKRLRKYRALSALYDAMVFDILETSSARIEASGVDSVEAVRAQEERLVNFSPERARDVRDLAAFLLKRVYLHPRTLLSSNKARRFLRELFEHHLRFPDQLPRWYQDRMDKDGVHRVLCDYIAGMTDRYFMEQYRACFVPEVVR